jgi:S-disulfanyl-L-cysteine oxidoreductase SoxD
MSRRHRHAGATLAVIALFGLGVTSEPAQSQQGQKVKQAVNPANKPAKKAGLGREALPEEIKAWDIDVRPDGGGLPPGKGSVAEGEVIYQAQCASCHGEFGEGVGRWPVLAGGHGSLKSEGPEKTIGSFWPYASTTFDYIKRAMPYGNARSLSDDEIYALTAYLLHMNDVVKEDFVLSRETFAKVVLPNAAGFYDDDREKTEKHFWKASPCMTNCQPNPARVTNRARVLDVTPDNKTGPKVD